MSEASIQNHSSPLAPEEIAFYHREGYLVPSFQLPTDLVNKMRRSFERLKSNSDVDLDVILHPHLGNTTSNNVPSHLAREWLEYARDESILDAVAQLIGEDFFFWSSAVFGKPAGNGKATPWHQDGHFWPLRPLATTTVWIALDETTPDNGCLKVIPRSHKKGHRSHEDASKRGDLNLTDELSTELFDESLAVDICLKPGQMSFHDVFTIHGSEPNTSGKRRLAFTLRYMPASSYYDREFALEQNKMAKTHDRHLRPLFLMRGQDLTRKNSLVVPL